jgi:hypothetical protein
MGCRRFRKQPGVCAIVPEGQMIVARLRKAYVAIVSLGFASPWLSGAP